MNLIFTSSELMVLVNVLGGTVLYGFAPDEPVSKQDVLVAANELALRGVLVQSEGGFRVGDDSLTQLLEPIRAPKTVVYLTQNVPDRPQVCYLLNEAGGVGLETVFVQRDAVRVFSVQKDELTKDVLERCALKELSDPVPDAQTETADFGCALDDSAQKLMEALPSSVAALERFDPGSGRMVAKTVLSDDPKGARAYTIKINEQSSTNDLPHAIEDIFQEEWGVIV